MLKVADYCLEQQVGKFKQYDLTTTCRNHVRTP